MQIESVVDLLTNGIIICDSNLSIKTWNRWLATRTNLKRADVLGKHLDKLFPEINTPILKRKIKTSLMLETPTFYSSKHGYLIPIKNEKITNSSYEYMQQSIKIVPHIELEGFVVIIINDETETKEAYKRINLLKDRATHYLEIIDEHVLMLATSDKGIITDASSALCRLNGYTKEELIGERSNILRHPDTKDELYADLWSTITSGATWNGELKNRKKDGSAYWIKTSIFYLEEENGEVIYQAIMEDISEQKAAEEISLKDSLTGLYNRRYFNEKSKEILDIAMREKQIFVFCVIDIDNFKKYNDTYGHTKGDEVLRSVAREMKREFELIGALSFRMGGEEFASIFCIDDIALIERWCRRIKEGIERLSIPHERNIPYNILTISLGACYVDTQQIQELPSLLHIYQKADDELYKIKSGARNGISIIPF